MNGGNQMAKKTKAIYDVVTTYGMHREMIFTLHNETCKSHISVINTRTGEYHQITYKRDFDDFLFTCEVFIKKHFGVHLNYFIRKSYQVGE